MHNKLLVANNQLAILGGRNIGDDYFGMSQHRNFIDLDILLSGPLAPDQLTKVRKRICQRLQGRPVISALAEDTDITDTIMRIAQGAEIVNYATVVDDPDVSWFDKPDEIVEHLTAVALQTNDGDCSGSVFPLSKTGGRSGQKLIEHPSAIAGALRVDHHIVRFC